MEVLTKAQRIIIELCADDSGSDIFCACDNDESEWDWIDTFMEKLVNMSEVK